MPTRVVKIASLTLYVWLANLAAQVPEVPAVPVVIAAPLRRSNESRAVLAQKSLQKSSQKSSQKSPPNAYATRRGPPPFGAARDQSPSELSKSQPACPQMERGRRTEMQPRELTESSY
jgi:hypothetical protein